MKKILGIGVLILVVIVGVVLRRRKSYTSKTTIIDEKITIITDYAASFEIPALLISNRYGISKLALRFCTFN